MEGLQIECQYGAPPPIGPCHDIVLVVLTAFVPFLADLGEYPDACPESCDALVNVLFLW